MALLWPRYIEKKWVDRTLAFFSNVGNVTSITTEDGTTTPFLPFTDMIISCFDNNLLLFVDDFASFPWIDECLKRGAYVPCTELGKPIAIRLKGPRNTTRWIVNAAAWGCTDLNVAWLKELREVYAYANVGTPGTPGATGQALMRKAWKEAYGEEGWKKHRHQRPSNWVCHQIANTSSGARSDTLDMGTSFEVAWEVDRKNAYGAVLAPLPTGPTYRIFKGCTNDWASYYVRCRVTVDSPLVLGPFPVRKKDDARQKGFKPYFPTQPGEYVTWLWKEEVEKARAAGCVVDEYEGWGWQEWTNDFQPFIDMMSEMRDQAPPHIAPYIKKFLVAAIGRFGMPNGMYVLSSEEDSDEKDRAICENGVAYDWFVHWIPDKKPTNMPHWFSFILMQCRLALYDVALPYAESEQLIATNTDAIIVKPGADVSNWPDRSPGVKTGEWRKRQLHEVVVPAARHLESVEKWTTPGVPESKRVRRYQQRE